jgi:hypothetical protein
VSDIVLFFGCNCEAGHHLINRSGASIRDFEADRLNVPRDRELDCSHIFLPHPEKVGVGALTYLPANDRTVLAWWGSPFDDRPNVNNAIIVSGYSSPAECWHRFSAAFPRLASQLTMPRIVAAP